MVNRATRVERWKGKGSVKVLRDPEGRIVDFKVMDKVARKKWAMKMVLARNRSRVKCSRCGKRIWKKHYKRHMSKHVRKDNWW